MNDYISYDDAALVALLKGGDRLAFTEIYNRYWDKLLSIAFRHTKDQSSAKEIVQGVFISIWNRRLDLEVQFLDRYLATAIKFSVFKNYYKKNKRETQHKAKMPFEDRLDIEQMIEARFLLEHINELAERLPEKCRMVFTYSRQIGLNIGEIAQKMNISEKTVESHLTRALKTLRMNLNRLGIFLVILNALFSSCYGV